MTKRTCLYAVACAALLLTVALTASADTELAIYNGTLDKITLSSWGAGKVKKGRRPRTPSGADRNGPDHAPNAGGAAALA